MIVGRKVENPYNMVSIPNSPAALWSRKVSGPSLRPAESDPHKKYDFQSLNAFFMSSKWNSCAFAVSPTSRSRRKRMNSLSSGVRNHAVAGLSARTIGVKQPRITVGIPLHAAQ